MRSYKQHPNPRDPGAWLDLVNMYPTGSGSYRTAPTFTKYGTAAAGPASPGGTLRAVLLGPANGSSATVYVGTTTKLYSAAASAFASGTFTDRSSGAYSGSTQWWDFAQFGNYTLATNGYDQIQVRDITGASAFAALGGTPPATAKKLCVQSGFVLAANTDLGTDYIEWSDLYDHADWVPGVGSEAGFLPLIARPGPIVDMVAFQNVVLVFKSDCILQIRYTGAPYFWTVEQIYDGRGAGCIGAVCVCDDAVVFSGSHGTSVFDGASFRDILTDGWGGGYGAVPYRGLGPNAVNSVADCLWFGPEGNVLSCSNGRITVTNLRKEQTGNYDFYNSAGSQLAGCAPLTGDITLMERYLTFEPVSGSHGTTAASGGLIVVRMSSNPCVLTAISTWDSGVAAASIMANYIGDDLARTYWDGVVPLLVDTRNHPLSAGTYIATTGLSLVPVRYAMPVAAAIEDTLSTVTSESGQRKFKFTANAQYMTLKISGNTGYWEIDDVKPLIKRAGLR